MICGQIPCELSHEILTIPRGFLDNLICGSVEEDLVNIPGLNGRSTRPDWLYHHTIHHGSRHAYARSEVSCRLGLVLIRQRSAADKPALGHKIIFIRMDSYLYFHRARLVAVELERSKKDDVLDCSHAPSR